MKRAISAIVMALAFSGACLAQCADETAVTQAVEQMRLAMLSAKKADLEKVGHPGLSYGHSSGFVENNNEFIDAITGGKSGFTTLAFNHQTVTLDGDTAIVRHIFEAKTNDAGKTPGEVKIGVMQTWKRSTAGEWKLFALQAYRLPQ